MQPRATQDYVWIGILHRYLMEIPAGTLLDGDQQALYYLDTYLAGLSTVGYTLTASAAWPLHGIRDEMAAEIVASANAVLTTEVATRIQQATLMMREVLYTEARSRTVFEVTDKRYDASKLLYDVGALLRPGTLEQLPTLSSYDLQESAICIAFARPTAAAFHALRGTEQALRHLYACYVRSNRMRKPWNWKPILEALEARSTKPPKVLLDNLDSLRENFRNPTQHPEAVYDIDEAQDLFAQCLDVLNRMVALPKWTPPPAEPGQKIAV